jgi:uncharacterized membrane protein
LDWFESYIDEISLVIFATSFVLYFLLLHLRIKQKNPTDIKVFKIIYRNWVKSCLSDENHTVGIQALRNFIRGNATFVSALFILLGLLLGFFDATLNLNGTFFWMDVSLALVKLFFV